MGDYFMNRLKSKYFKLGIHFVMGLFLIAPFFSDAQGAIESTCINCHLAEGDELAKPVIDLRKSIHLEKEVACHDCHGGDPTAKDPDEAMSEDKGFKGAPDYKDIPEFCAKCHADPNRMKHYNLRTDQLAEYKTSQHGRLLYEKGDKNVATCVSCHGNHDVKSKNDPTSPVFKTNIPKTCSKCHSDAKRMASYGIPTDQYEQYEKSVHGDRLLVKKDLKAPECADCHGIHGASPPGFTDIANVCSYCHGKIAEYFKESPHYIGKTKEKGARCVNCHGNHNIQKPTTALYTGSGKGHCGECHKQGSKSLSIATPIKEKIDLAIASVAKAKEGLESVRNSGKNLDYLQESYEHARSSMVQSRAMAHTLSMKKIESSISSVVDSTDKVEKEVDKIKRELKTRKRSIIIVLLILGTIMGVLIVKIKSLGKENMNQN
jgi:hypothetical protein